MKVKIVQNDPFLKTDIYIYEQHEQKRSLAQPVELIFKDIKEADYSTDSIKPTISIHQEFAFALFKALADELHRNGVRTDQDELNEGELKALKNHLEDLRKLLKL
jgi:hypothetical protein